MIIAASLIISAVAITLTVYSCVVNCKATRTWARAERMWKEAERLWKEAERLWDAASNDPSSLLACPLCGQHFESHEWRDIDGKSSEIRITNDSGRAICPDCTVAGRGERWSLWDS